MNLKNNNCSKWIEDQNIRVEVGFRTKEIKNQSKLIKEELTNDILKEYGWSMRNPLEFSKFQELWFKRNITFIALDLSTSINLD